MISPVEELDLVRTGTNDIDGKLINVGSVDLVFES